MSVDTNPTLHGSFAASTATRSRAKLRRLFSSTVSSHLVRLSENSEPRWRKKKNKQKL